MNSVETYRPANIQFDVDGNKMPENLGFFFDSSDQAVQFFQKHISGINSKVRASRYMDNYEKKQIREDYQQLLEQKIPLLERECMKAKAAYEEAKKAFADANELVNATFNEAKSLAQEVRRGIVEMELDELFTWRVPVGDKYYFYTIIDGQIKLCKVLDIPHFEREEIFNIMHHNEEFFASHYVEGIKIDESFDEKATDTNTGEIADNNPEEKEVVSGDEQAESQEGS